MEENQSAKPRVAARILYVEDDFDSGELIRYLLTQENESYSITVVATYAEAVSLISEQAFDLYIIDYCLSSKSGIQLCRHIRETDRETPVLFYSAISRQADRDRAAEAGANEYLVKPQDLEILTKKVNQHLFKWALTK